jgi:hypothetical protein
MDLGVVVVVGFAAAVGKTVSRLLPSEQQKTLKLLSWSQVRALMNEINLLRVGWRASSLRIKLYMLALHLHSRKDLQGQDN